MIDVKAITALQAETVKRWHEEEIDNLYHGFMNLVCRQHQQNFRLWHEEDIARSSDVNDTELAAVKRRIDKLNQRRNDQIEQLDDAIIEQLRQRNIAPLPSARLNTETPGSAIDRLSILALRIYHMQEQIQREEAGPEHCQAAAAKLDVLMAQLDDLSRSLNELLTDIFAGRRQMKVYRQMKMYNDPTMNPYLYTPRKGKSAA
ncbi:MAG TPA: DUF4254 domain-containing protein [Thermoguttaceae bacterium]|nr:DUF4254 domain-containing protein [Thermoguttaceae bacterium]